MRGWQGIALICGLAVSAVVTCSPTNAQSRPVRRAAWHGCGALLPRNSFPAGMTAWTSWPTAPNSGAATSGLQLARYPWGYVIVTPDVYGSLRGAEQRYAMLEELLRGDQQVRLRPIGQAAVAWITHDGVVGDTVTTILLRAARTVAMVNVGAERPALGVAVRLAHAVVANRCR